LKTSFERPSLGSLTEVDTKSQEKRYTVTLIRTGDSEEISMEMITAPGQSAAFLNAQRYFPDARILSVDPVPEPLPLRAAKDAKPSPSARFIRGMFRPALFQDENDLRKLSD
jgi:hypothetical protein